MKVGITQNMVGINFIICIKKFTSIPVDIF